VRGHFLVLSFFKGFIFALFQAIADHIDQQGDKTQKYAQIKKRNQ